MTFKYEQTIALHTKKKEPNTKTGQKVGWNIPLHISFCVQFADRNKNSRAR